MSSESGRRLGSPVCDCQPARVPGVEHYHEGQKDGERPGELRQRTTGFAALFDVSQCDEREDAAHDRDGEADPAEQARTNAATAQGLVGRAGTAPTVGWLVIAAWPFRWT
jgi:hypothetical protein